MESGLNGWNKRVWKGRRTKEEKQKVPKWENQDKTRSCGEATEIYL